MSNTNTVKVVVEIDEAKVRLSAAMQEATLKDQEVSYQEVSARTLGIESLRDEYGISSNDYKAPLVDELYDLTQTATEDHQMVVQGNPSDRNDQKFGAAAVRLARRENIIYKLTN